MGQEKWENNRQKQNYNLYYADRRSNVARYDGADRNSAQESALKRVRSELVVLPHSPPPSVKYFTWLTT